MPINRHQRHLNTLAYLTMDLPKVAGVSTAAAVVLYNKIVAFGSNRDKTDPIAARHSKHELAISLHAEHAAIKNAINRLWPKDIAGATLYVARTKQIRQPDGSFITTWGNACPCSGCRDAIATYKIRRIFYTTDQTGNYVCENI